MIADKLDKVILECIVSAALPFRIVENEDFRLLIETGYRGRKLMSRPTVVRKLNTIVAQIRANVLEKLAEPQYIASTADCWSVHKKSCLGVTANVIDAFSLERMSGLLAIRRIKGRHTYDVLTSMMEAIYNDYGILHKITYTTADNGSNFVKAFTIYGATDNVEPSASNATEESSSDTEE